MTKIQVNITKDILFKTRNCSSNKYTGTSCAIAHAVNSLLPNCWITQNRIFVFDKNTIEDLLSENNGNSIFDYDNICKIALPEVAQDFIDQFDNKNADERLLMDEISFEIDVPDEALQNIDISDIKNLLKNSKTLSLV